MFVVYIKSKNQPPIIFIVYYKRTLELTLHSMIQFQREKDDQLKRDGDTYWRLIRKYTGLAAVGPEEIAQANLSREFVLKHANVMNASTREMARLMSSGNDLEELLPHLEDYRVQASFKSWNKLPVSRRCRRFGRGS